MLLTSSQVSVAVSSGVVILFTSALFFSGYALQQKTLNDLRRAIREPPPEPLKIFLPDRFNAMTTELEDGTIVVIDQDAEGGSTEAGSQQPKNEQAIVEVAPSVPGADDQQQGQQQQQGEDVQQEQQAQAQAQAQAQPQEQQQTQETLEHGLNTNAGETQPGVGKAAPQGVPQEVRRVPQEQAVPREYKKPERPVSRAERRRKIKEELRESSHFSKPMLYQRRLY